MKVIALDDFVHGRRYFAHDVIDFESDVEAVELIGFGLVVKFNSELAKKNADLKAKQMATPVLDGVELAEVESTVVDAPEVVDVDGQSVADVDDAPVVDAEKPSKSAKKAD